MVVKDCCCGNGKGGRYAFTLIEMLIVIAIISILAAMLSPSLRHALNSAKSLACLNNQRQANIGVNIFKDEHNGLLFVDWEYQGGKLRYWHESLLGQITNKKKFFTPIVDDRLVLGCPIRVDDVKMPVSTGSWLFGNSRGYYGGNSWLWSKYPKARVVIDEGDFYDHYYLRLSSIPSPSSRMFLLDSRAGRLYYDKHGWAFPGVAQQMTDCTPHSFQNSSYPRAVWLGHNSGANVLYLDGHAAHKNMAELYQTGVTCFIDENFDKLSIP